LKDIKLPTPVPSLRQPPRLINSAARFRIEDFHAEVAEQRGVSNPGFFPCASLRVLRVRLREYCSARASPVEPRNLRELVAHLRRIAL
jgi:hypothetical protein